MNHAMRTLARAYAVERGNVDTDLDPRARAILERMARVAYVLDCHRQAIARHSRQLTELQAELDEMEPGK